MDIQQQPEKGHKNISHQEVKYSTTCMGRADNELITTGHSREVKVRNTITITPYTEITFIELVGLM